MKVIKTINQYFLVEEGETIHWSDLVWFYGGYGIISIILTLLIFSN